MKMYIVKALGILLSLTFLAFIIWCLSATVTTLTKEPDRSKRILVLTKSSDSEFWKTVYKGAETAANEYNNVELIIEAPVSEDDYGTQNRMIRSAVDKDIDVIVFSACDYDRSVESVESAIDKGIPVISIDSYINSDKVQLMIGTDNVAAGVQAGEAIGALTGYNANIGIINCEEGGAVGIQREEGFLKVVAKNPGMKVIETRYAFSNVEDSKKNTLEILKAHPEINAIATFNEWTTLGVQEALYELGIDDDSMAAIGFDSNVKSVEMLEIGVYDGLIVQNPFEIGYLGVKSAIDYDKKKYKQPRFIDTGTKLITAENMYNIENQKLLFPFSN